MLLDKSVIKQWIQEGSKPIKANLSFLREDKFIEKFTSTYNDSNLTSKEKYKVNCDFERYWGLYYKKKYGTLTENQTAWTGWLGEHLFQEYCNKRKYNYCCRPKTTAGFQIDFEVFKTENSISLWDYTWFLQKENAQPTDKAITSTNGCQSYYVEVKAGAYTVGGTAHEKILGVPFKYEKVVEKKSKPVLILCIGSAEKFGWKYGLFNDFTTGKIQENPSKILEFFNKTGFTYYPFSFLLQENSQLPILSKPS